MFRFIGFLTFGMRSKKPKGWRPGLQLRAGLDYQRADAIDDALYGFLGSASFTVDCDLRPGPVHFSLGFSGRVGTSISEEIFYMNPALKRNAFDAVVGIAAPIFTGTALGLGVMIPVAGSGSDRKPTVTATIDWAQLLSNMTK